MPNADIDMASKAEEVARTIQQDKRGRWWRYALGILLFLGVTAITAWWMYPREQTVSYVTQLAARGDMTLTATATGDLQPKRTVAIGAELSGMIESVEVEANERVTTGQVLLRFDTESLDNALEQAQASLDSAKAGQRRAQATLDAAKIEYQRTETLAQKKMAPTSELDERKAARLRAVADLESARASVTRARAELDAAKTRLEKATITSPINGVVLARNVEGGNTVASSLQTPELFVLAEDLSQMELHISVDEADIGLVTEGQQAKFGVDAWPERRFDAVVRTVSLSPTVTDNVVTYIAILTVDNSEGLLRPGMTATATITTGVREDILQVPNAALRFTPTVGEPDEDGPSFIPMRGRGRRGGSAAAPGNTVWVLRDGVPASVQVRTGRSDGRYTEIIGGELAEGDSVVLAMRTGEAAKQADSSDKADKREGRPVSQNEGQKPVGQTKQGNPGDER
jgi:HlyD family secretion protein